MYVYRCIQICIPKYDLFCPYNAICVLKADCLVLKNQWVCPSLGRTTSPALSRYSGAGSSLCTIEASWAFLHLLVNFYNPNLNLVMRKKLLGCAICLVQNV